MNKIKLESKIIDFIQRYSLVSPGETVVAGVSGGADSVCLLHVLAKWRKRLGINLHVAHLNHQLRGVESEADAKYVSDLTGSLGIPVTIDRQDVADYRLGRNLSVEEAARELRYAFFARVAGEVGANRIAIGHTRDDQVETILMHILRGTGVTGLCGLAPCSPYSYSGRRACSPMAYESQGTTFTAEPLSIAKGQRSNLLVIRPLLDISREETTSYCQEHHLAPRIDSSNVSLSFFRNRIRLQLLPQLRQYNPSIDQALLRLADIAKEDNAFIEQQASLLWDEVARQENNAIYLDRKQIASLPIALQRQLLRAAVTRLAGDTRDIEAGHIEAARSLLDKPVGKRISLPHGIICQGGYDEIVIATHCAAKNRGTGGEAPSASCPFPPLSGEFHLTVPGKTVFPGWKVTASIIRGRVDEGHYEYQEGARHSPGIAKPVPSVSEESRREIASALSRLAMTKTDDKEYAPRNDRGECHPESRCNRDEESRPAQGRLGEAISADFDLHKTGTELFVRQRWPGDKFQPLGMDMPKKLREFMVDAKIPRSWRGRIPIVCSPQQIIWVVGWRIDDRVKVTEASKEILRLEFIGSP
ncbi:MAG: tRNA lysidine(34) synthetase TilS [Chloroflexota bacterium]